MKRYIAITPTARAGNQSATHMRIETYYSKGGMNVFTYRNEKRGYYLMLTPVERDGIMESFVAFTGKKIPLREVSRASKKQETEAESEAESYLRDCLEHDCAQMGYKLA